MDSDLTRLTVFFEAPFWVGVFERFEGGTLSVCKITFGAEPKDYDVLSYVLKITRGSDSVRLSQRLSGRMRQIRSVCSGRSEGLPPVAAWGQRRSRHCSCSGRSRSWNGKRAPANSGTRKSS